MKPLQQKSLYNVILAVDGSQHSLAAIELLRDLSFHPNSTLTAIAVLDTPHTPRRQLLLEALDQAAALLKQTGLNVTTGLLHGHIADTLIHYANDHRPDLIILGAKGLRATLGILLGGVVQQVVEHAHWPVLVIRPPYEGLRRVLLVSDGSACSRAAVHYLSRFPLPQDCQVQVMHVLPAGMPERVELYTYPWAMAGEVVPPLSRPVPEPSPTEAEWLAGQALLDEVVTFLGEQGIPATSVLRQGDAATEILSQAEQTQADLIVCGSRGLSPVRGWLLGSVSRKLVHYAACSVLVVRGEGQELACD